MLLAAVSAVAAGTTPGGAPPLIERVTSEIVLIEVYATDAWGGPVRGLTKEDFTLEVEGHRRPIASLEFHEIQSAPAAPAALPATGPGPGVAAGLGSAPAPGAAAPQSAVPAGPRAANTMGSGWPRRFAFFFEDNVSGPIDLTQARQAADKLLETGLTPTDQVALVSYDQRLRLLHDFTTDRGALRSALARSLKDASRFSDFPAEDELLHEDFDSNPTPAHLAALCEQERKRMSSSLRAVESLVTSLSQWRGYKAIVFMGDGFSDPPMTDLWRRLERTTGQGQGNTLFQGTCILGDEVRQILRAASAAGVVIDTIQTTGLDVDEDKKASDKEGTLRTLSFNTGGTFSNSNDFAGALRAVERDSAALYVLGYEPVEKADGRFHSVIVRCRKEGVSLRYRRGFARLPPDEVRANALDTAYLFPEMMPRTGLELQAVQGPSAEKDRVVDLVLYVPSGGLLFLPGPNGAAAKITVGFVGLEGSRKTLDTSRTVSIRRASGSSDLSGVNLYCRARLPLAEQTVTAVIRDENSEVVGAARATIPSRPPGDLKTIGLALYSPSHRSVWVEVPPTPPADGSALSPAGKVGPALTGTFMAGEPAEAGFRWAPGARSPASYRLEIRAAGEVVRSRTVEAAAGDPAASIQVGLPVEGLAAGAYDVAVLALFDGNETEAGVTPLRIVEPEAAPAP